MYTRGAASPPVNILVYNYEYPPLGGGAGRAAFQVARRFAGRGHHVHVVTSAWGDLRGTTDEDGVEVHRLPAMRRHADRSDVAQMLAYMSAASAWTAARAPRFSSFVALAYFAIPGGPPALLLRMLSRCPYVLSLRGGDVPGFRSGAPSWASLLARPLLRAVWSGAHSIVANSRSLADLARVWNPTRPIDVIPNGVDTKHFHPADGTRSNGPLKVISVGRLSAQKDFATLVQAAGRCGRNEVELRIVGDGPERGALEAMARREGANVAFRGWLSSDEVARELRSADVMVLLTRDEGMSNAILEGMASGLPIIATDVPGNRELLAGTGVGLLVPPNDADAVVRTLRELAAANGSRREMADRARCRAESFSWDQTADRYEESLHAALVPAARTPIGRGVRPLGVLEIGSRYARALAATLTMPDRVRETPLHIQVEPSSACNLDCSFCSRSKVIPRPRNMKVDEFERILVEMRPHKITLSGYGEPLIHPKLESLIALAKRMGADVNTTSNGILLTEKRAEGLVESGLDLLSVSLDASTSPTYLKIRGEDKFEQILTNLRGFVRVRGQARKKRPFLRLCFVLTSINLREATSFVDIARDVGANSILYQILELTGMEEKRALFAGSMRRDALEGVLKEANQRARGTGVVTNAPILLADLEREYRKYELSVEDRTLCPMPYFSTYIQATGNLMPCCRFAPTPVSMGNVLEKGLESVWNGARYERIRREFRSGARPFPICKNCNPETIGGIVRRAPVSRGFLTLW